MTENEREFEIEVSFKMTIPDDPRAPRLAYLEAKGKCTDMLDPDRVRDINIDVSPVDE